MAYVRVEGVLGSIVVGVDWRDGEVSGDPVLVEAVRREVARAGDRFLGDPLAFAAFASNVVERYGKGPARVVTEGVEESLARGMEGLSAATHPPAP
jgi:hypothetical protein